MILSEPVQFVKTFIDDIDKSLSIAKPGARLSWTQRTWLAFCISAILIVNSLCWTDFEKISLGQYKVPALSWMFRCSKIPWDRLLTCSIGIILKLHDIKEGMLVIDDTDRYRSKKTTQIANVHKLKDKKSGGYVMGQNIVFLLLVTSKLSIPVGFAFYQPNPELKAWRVQDKLLQKKGVKKKERPAKPEKNIAYPSKQDVALILLRKFAIDFKTLTIKCILADALYGSKDFMAGAGEIYKNVQLISQLRSNQIIHFRSRQYTVKHYFEKFPGNKTVLSVRSGIEKNISLGGARLVVKAHGAKRFVIALSYEGEDMRYLVATDLSWRMTDIAYAYTMRWLVEVFFSDWKRYEGWCHLAKQPGIEGSCRGVILSLLTDHALLTHECQTALLKHKLPACTVGSLREKIKFDALVEFMQGIIKSENPQAMLADCIERMNKLVVLAPSSKHLGHRDLKKLEPLKSAKYEKAA